LLRQAGEFIEPRALTTKYFSLGQHEGKTRNVILSELQNRGQGQNMPTQITLFIELQLEKGPYEVSLSMLSDTHSLFWTM